jgi:PAS domain S-box-containing protein
MTRPVVTTAVENEAELLSLLIGSVTDYAIYAMDPDGLVSTWNPGAERVKGYRAEEIIGQHFSRFYTEVDIAAGKPDMELAIAAAEGSFEDEGWRVRKDGSLFWASVVVTALRGGDGRLVGFGKVTRDLTERKRGEDALRAGEQRFRLLVSSVADYAIFLLTPEGKVASWNRGAERLKGYQADEIIGQHFSRFYTDGDRRRNVPDQGLRAALAQGRWESEGWRLRKDGSRFWANAVITALHGDDGRHEGFAKVTRDLTDRKRSEDALRGVLERERTASERLRELDRMRNELVAIIAHDLREPIGVVQNLLHVLGADWDGSSDEEKLQSIERISLRVETLGALADDVFDLALLDAGHLRVDLAPFDLDAVITRVVHDITASAPQRVVRVDLDGAWAFGDGRRTLQVLGNLVSNALKFSAPDTPIGLTSKRIDDEVIVSVTDGGAGIPAEQQPLLFQRFTRLPQDADTAGSGIGLFIAKSLIAVQHGRLWVESAPGTGSTFRFALPLAPDSP